MIIFKKKPAPIEVKPVPATPAGNPEASAEEAASARRKKSDSDGTLRRKRQIAEDNRLL
jgi:hypothetical protein